MRRPVRAVGELRRAPWSVRSHLLGIVAVAAGVLLIVGSISTALSFRDARRNALDRADSEARLVATEVSSAIDEARESLAATVASGGLAGVFGNPEGDCTLTSGGSGPFISGDLHLLRPSGTVFCSSAEHAVGVDYGGLAWVDPLSMEEPVVTSAFEDPFTEARAVAVAMSATDPTGDVAGAVALVLYLDDLAEGLRASSEARRSLAINVIELRTDAIVSTSETDAVSGDSRSTIEQSSDSATKGLDGVARYYGSAPIEGLGWQAVVGLDAAIADATAQAELRRRITSSALLVLFLIALVLILNRRIARPLETLSAALSAAGDDPSPPLVAVKGPAEIVQLGTSFNSMIQDRVEYENRMIQSQKVQAIGQLAGGIAHDFNNMLAAISSYGHLLLDDLQGDPRRADVEEIVKAADRGTALTRRLLTFSRRDASEPRFLDISAVVDDAAKLLRQMIREDIELSYAIDPACGRIFMDPVELDQILVNLVVNARDAMPRGGKIAISAQNATVGEAGDGLVALSVADEGEGVPEAVRSRIFDPFFSTKTKEKGTGLGLSVVLSLVDKAGGRIEVTSQEGIGTTFTIFFPRATGDDATQEEPEENRTTEGGGRRILVVEDEEMVRRSTVRLLQKHNFDVFETDSGIEALRMLQEGLEADLLLTDLIMPKMPGIELARKAGLPVIYLSGYSDSVVAGQQRMLESDEDTDPRLSIAEHLIQKPYKPHDLMNAIEAALSDRPRGSKATEEKT